MGIGYIGSEVDYSGLMKSYWVSLSLGDSARLDFKFDEAWL